MVLRETSASKNAKNNKMKNNKDLEESRRTSVADQSKDSQSVDPRITGATPHHLQTDPGTFFLGFCNFHVSIVLFDLRFFTVQKSTIQGSLAPPTIICRQTLGHFFVIFVIFIFSFLISIQCKSYDICFILIYFMPKI